MSNVKIQIDPSEFVPTLLPYLNRDEGVQLFTGTAGSGKSVFLYQRAILFAMTKSYFRLLFCRKVAKNIRDSVFLGFKDIIADWGIGQYFRINETNMNLTCTLNGNKLISHGLDDPEKVKSVKDISHVLIEEMSELDFNDFAQLQIRLRTEKVKKTQLWGAFNPIYEFKWGRDYFFEDKGDTIPEGVVPAKTPDTLIVKTHFRHNPHINAEAYEEKIRTLAGSDENYWNVYGLGNWGKSQKGSEYYRNFSKSRHVAPCDYVDGLPIHLAWDFNAHPYVACSVWQLEEVDGRIKARCILHLMLTSVEATCRYFTEEVPHWAEAGLFYYGDASGLNSLPVEVASNFYTVIDNGLRGLVSRQSRRLLRKNPNHRSLSKGTLGRQDFMNRILTGEFGVDVIIDPVCAEVIEDFEMVKQDANNAKLKTKIKGPDGITYEPLGHFSDGIDGMFAYLYGKWARR